MHGLDTIIRLNKEASGYIEPTIDQRILEAHTRKLYEEDKIKAQGSDKHKCCGRCKGDDS